MLGLYKMALTYLRTFGDIRKISSSNDIVPVSYERVIQ